MEEEGDIYFEKFLCDFSYTVTLPPLQAGDST